MSVYQIDPEMRLNDELEAERERYFYYLGKYPEKTIGPDWYEDEETINEHIKETCIIKGHNKGFY